MLKANPGVGVTTDLDGNYSFKILDSTPQIILISYISFNNIEETVNPRNGEIIVKNFVMQDASKELGVVEVTAKANKAPLIIVITDCRSIGGVVCR